MADPIVQEIKEKIDIAEIIGEYVQLRRAGINLKGLCPFHNEKTPSFMVSRERASWKCFGCGEGGDAFSFLQKHEGLTFPEVLKILADKTGVPMPERRVFEKEQYNKEAELREELLQINELAARFYHEALLRSQSGQAARDYLQKRGLKAETIKKWQLGFAPDDWHQLETFLAKRGFNKEKAIAAGLLVRGQGGQIYDRFRFRVNFPLLDHYGRVVGFTARALREQDGAKYVNSPETAIYHKSKLLYGYYFAKKAVRTADAIVVAEGNVDVISSHQAGVENVVASSGTALTPDQLNLISRLTKNIIFAFDTDKAGLSATRRALELALASGFNIRIAQIQGGKDPDDLIRQDPGLWEKTIASAPNFLDFTFSLLFDKIKDKNKEALRTAANEYLQVVSLVNDAIVQAQEAKRISEKLDVPMEAILDHLKRMQNKRKVGLNVAPGTLRPKTNLKNRRELLEERVIGLSLVSDRLRHKLAEILQPSDFSTVASLAESVIKNTDLSAAGNDKIGYFQFLGEEELNRLKEEYPDEVRIDKLFVDLCQGLKGLSIREKMKDLAKQIADHEKSGNLEQLEIMRQNFNELSNSLAAITKE